MKPLHTHLTNYELSCQLAACRSNRRRNGKVARLSVELRDQINQMLEEGTPYKISIQRLGDAGKHLNEDNIGNWYRGGYQDHLKTQVIKDRAALQIEAVVETLQNAGPFDLERIQQACNEIAMLQYFQILMDHGKESLQQSLDRNPAKMFSLINSCRALSKSALVRKKRDDKKGGP